MVNFQPSLETDTFTWDKLIADGMPQAKGVTLKQISGQSAVLARGTMLCLGTDGKYHPLAASETTVALNDVLFKDDFGAGAATEWDFTLAKPPIPGTLQVVTVDQGTTTVVLNAGTDNGRGVGSGADGTFTVDYNTGRVRVVFSSAPSDDDDGTFTYKHRNPNAAALGLPVAILAEDIAAADLDAGDVVTVAYYKGRFRSAALVGYSAGYQFYLNQLGIYLAS